MTWRESEHPRDPDGQFTEKHDFGSGWAARVAERLDNQARQRAGSLTNSGTRSEYARELRRLAREGRMDSPGGSDASRRRVREMLNRLADELDGDSRTFDPRRL